VRRRDPAVARRTGPAERVRRSISIQLGPAVAERLPDGFQRLGPVVILRLPPELRRVYAAIGAAWSSETGVRTVLNRTGPVTGEFRRPSVERVWGDGTETELVENGIRFHLDAARVMFAPGNQGERRRIAGLVRPGETIVDLFAGIGYFTLPALVHGRAARVFAVEKNPVSFRYLERNLQLNGVADRATAILGDNRDVGIPTGSAERVFLGLLPTSIPWVGRALELLAPDGGVLHVHLVVDVRAGLSGAQSEVRLAVERSGGQVASIAGRSVKSYGPGRAHVVVDVRATTPRR
jgi:tRNA wybutosine-synthesizing protein 2